MTEAAVLNVSEDLYLALYSFGLTKERIVSESQKLLAKKYFQEKLLSLGKATELSGLSKWDFIEYLSENGVPVVDYDDVEIDREFQTVNQLVERL
jgi:predicted HTH domain antitoxin